MNIKQLFPIFESVANQDKKAWRKNLIAGITVSVMLVPQGMAYAVLAGVAPIHGLYAGLVPLFLYAILGSSRQMSIGPVAISALLILAGVSQIAEPFTPEYTSLVILTGLLIGIVQTLLGVFRLGILVNFISHPVIIGFTSAAAIIIAVSQLKDFLGISIPRFAHAYETINYTFQHLFEINWTAAIFCLGSILLMFLFRKISKAIPGALIVVVIGTLIAYLIGENNIGIDLVRDVPEGLPSFQMPMITLENIRHLLPTVFTVTIIGIVESIGIAKVLQAKHGNYQVRPNQELIALGISKIGGAFFQSIPTSGSFTRSAVNNESGATSGLASIITAFIIGLTLLFFTPIFYFLPKAVLAAIILFSVKGLFEWKEAVQLWRFHRKDFWMMLITFIVTLIFGIEEGVLAGVLISISMVLLKSTQPHMAVLGKLPDTTTYRNVNRFDVAEQVEGTLIVRFDEQLYFANAAYFQDTVQQFIKDNEDPIQLFILDAGSIHSIDSVGIHALEELYKFCQSKNIKLYIAGMVGPVRDVATRAGLIALLGEKNQFLDIHQAILHYKNINTGLEKGWTPDALQSNPQ